MLAVALVTDFNAEKAESGDEDQGPGEPTGVTPEETKEAEEGEHTAPSAEDAEVEAEVDIMDDAGLL